MKGWFTSFMVAVGLLALAACAAKEEVAPAAPAPEAKPEAKPAWEEEWERVLAAAKREGKVVVSGQSGFERRQALTEPFEKKYGLTVEYQPDVAERIKTERLAGQYLWDVIISGGNTPMRVLAPIGALDPIEPALILPEVKDPTKWFGGKITFFDQEERLLINMFAAKSAGIHFNPDIVRPGEIKGWKDLLDPKWKGKILADDPSRAGPGQAKWRFMAVHKDLGPNYIRSLLRQEITFSRDEEQMARWVVAGRYPVCIGCSQRLANRLRAEGLHIQTLTDPLEGIDITGGWGQVGLLNRAPHPNAAKVYLNWLLSKEGQTELAKLGLYAPLRLDVTTEYVEPWLRPKEGDARLDTDPRQKQAQAIIDPIFKEFFR